MTISAVLVKYIGKSYNTWEILLIRCSFALFFILLLNAKIGTKLFHSPQPKLLAIRSFVLVMVVAGNIYAFIHLPLVQVTAIQFTKPLFLVVFAAFFLGEKVRFLRTAATIIGFIGVLIVLRPDGSIHPAQILILIAAISMAVMVIMTKKLLKDHTPITLILYGNILCIAIFLPLSIKNWQPLTLEAITLIALLGLSNFCGQYCLINAYKYGETTSVTPFEYVRIIFVSIAGYFFFSEIPDSWTIIGVTIICAATLFIALREAYKKAKKKSQTIQKSKQVVKN
jgi:drug/metabolite transporter (DMT)-like permease